MNIESLVNSVTAKYNLTSKQQELLLNQYKDDDRNLVTIETELDSLGDYYKWQNIVEKAIDNATPLTEPYNYYIRTYDENSNIKLQEVQIEKIGETSSGINQIEKVIIDNKYIAYKKKNKVDVVNNDLEIAICQIGNLLRVSGAEEYIVYDKDKKKDSIISKSVATDNFEEYYDFTSLYYKVLKYIKDGKIKNSKVQNYEEFEFKNSEEDYIKVIEQGIQIVRSLPTISQKEIIQIKNDYLDMLIFGYITNQVDRNLNNYGLICNKKEKRYYFAPLFENSIIEMPNINENQCSFNGHVCNRNKLIDTLIENYYEDINDKLEYIVNNKNKLIKNIDVIAKQYLNIDDYNKLMNKIINNINHIEEKYNEKNNIVREDNGGFANILNMIILLTVITIISISIAVLIYRL